MYPFFSKTSCAKNMIGSSGFSWSDHSRTTTGLCRISRLCRSLKHLSSFVGEGSLSWPLCQRRLRVFSWPCVLDGAYARFKAVVDIAHSRGWIVFVPYRFFQSADVWNTTLLFESGNDISLLEVSYFGSDACAVEIMQEGILGYSSPERCYIHHRCRRFL